MRWIKISEEQIELEHEAFALSGESRGLREAFKVLMDRAAQAFMEGDDDTAGLLRSLAKDFNGRSLHAWSKHEEVRAAALALGQCEDIEGEPGGGE